MGSSFKKLLSYFSKQDEARILILGLDAAGKTSVLYMSKLGEVVTTIPTIGFNVETITAGNLSITAWDIGGRDKARLLWRYYFANTSAIVFVIDSNDHERISEACDELHRMANEEELRNLPILIFANKQDLPNILTLDEIKEKLNLSKLDQLQTKWYLQPSVATKNEGLDEGFRWLANVIQSKTDYTQPIMETINDSKKMKNDLLYNFKTLLSKFI
jgi:ADP-ribosylation factor protein 1